MGFQLFHTCILRSRVYQASIYHLYKDHSLRLCPPLFQITKIDQTHHLVVNEEMQSEKNETITSSRPGDDSIPPSTDFSEKTVSENDPVDNEAVSADPEQAQPLARSEVEPPPDGGYGWVCVLCVFLVNAHTWGINSVGFVTSDGDAFLANIRCN